MPDRALGFGVGLDYQSLRANHGLHPLVMQCDLAHRIPLSSEQFAHAITLAVLEHICDRKPMLAELSRILVPGGSLIITWLLAAMDPILDAIPTIRVVIGEMESDKHRARIAFETLLATLREIGPTQFTRKQFEFGINNLLVSWKP